MPLAHRDPKKPILHPVPPGHVTVGFELHNSLGIQKGDVISFMNHSFTVHLCHAERGNKDDVSIWLDLSDAQQLLDKQGLINGIMALECKCAFANLAKVRKEIQGILPDTQVIEFQSQALARAEARQTAAEVAATNIEAERSHAAQQAQQRESMAFTIITFIFIAMAVVLLLMVINQIRERRYEIGVLRAIGVQTSKILTLLINKILILSLLGTSCGFITSLILTHLYCDFTVYELFDWPLVCTVSLASPVLCLLTAWLPILHATHNDVAHLLKAN